MYEKITEEPIAQGFGLLTFGKPLFLPTASTAPVFVKLSLQISARHKCFPFNLSMFTIHRIFPNLLQNKYCFWVIFTLSVCPFVPCFIPRSRKPTIRISVLALINKKWSIIFELLLFTPFLLQQRWLKSRSRTLLVLLSVFIYHPVGSVALHLAAIFGSTNFCQLKTLK